MRKKVDDRIRTLIDNGVKLRHRSMFVIVGDKSRDQIVNLNYMLSKSSVNARPNVLWCYKDKLELSSHRKKRAKQVKKLLQRGLLDPEKVDPFSLFVESGNITYCLYKDSERVLGNTFGMCILQDFEAVTPNLLARTIETVAGGGLVILLLRSLPSLTSLYAMTMDVHERFRTESHSQAAARFNERFLLSIALCKACVVMDDELNVLPISSHIRSIQPVSITEDPEGLSEKERELKNMKEQFNDDFPVGSLVRRCCTLDQGKAVITFLDAVLDKTLRSTVALIAARGRGKSAALGLAVAGAIVAGYSNIFVTAPSPENLKTLFEFVCKGLNALDYKEHLHYDLVRSADPDLKKVTVQINVYKLHRQTIQYLKPCDHGKLSQVELLVIDEAAAIPLPTVKSLLGPYLVFLSSTVSGYEGTGRSLSLKLLQQLQSESQRPTKSVGGAHSGRLFRKIELNESIRYAPGDPIESWLHGLLCLDVTSYIPSITRFPPAEKCKLYYVNRDTLFSYHKQSELCLQRMMALYVASHYKNSPNDLQLMADAPSHHLFVLLGPDDESKDQIPDIFCVLQVCLEGKISRKSALKSLSEGHQPSGDQIPWKFSEQFQDDVFPSLSGARIVRIAVHPDAMRNKYGSTAVELLTSYYEGKMACFMEGDAEQIEEKEVKVTEVAKKVSLLQENVMPRANLPPLFVPLHERRTEKLHYLGVSFGLTHDLFRFWRKHNFTPFYISHISSSVTGEHTCMVLKPLNNDEIESGESNFLAPFYQDFRQRFMRLLGTTFRKFNYMLAMSILAPKLNFKEHNRLLAAKDEKMLSSRDLLSPQDMKRLESYTNNSVDYHMILDLLPILAHQYFQEKIPVSLTSVQASILFCMGMQHKDITCIKKEMVLKDGESLKHEVILSLFSQVVKKLYNYLYEAAANEIDSVVPHLKEKNMTAGNDSMYNPEDVDREGDFERLIQNEAGKLSASGVVSVKSSSLAVDRHRKPEEHCNSKRKGGNCGNSSSENKRKKLC